MVNKTDNILIKTDINLIKTDNILIKTDNILIKNFVSSLFGKLGANANNNASVCIYTFVSVNLKETKTSSSCDNIFF